MRKKRQPQRKVVESLPEDVERSLAELNSRPVSNTRITGRDFPGNARNPEWYLLTWYDTLNPAYSGIIVRTSDLERYLEVAARVVASRKPPARKPAESAPGMIGLRRDKSSAS